MPVCRGGGRQRRGVRPRPADGGGRAQEADARQGQRGKGVEAQDQRDGEREGRVAGRGGEHEGRAGEDQAGAGTRQGKRESLQSFSSTFLLQPFWGSKNKFSTAYALVPFFLQFSMKISKNCLDDFYKI